MLVRGMGKEGSMANARSRPVLTCDVQKRDEARVNIETSFTFMQEMAKLNSNMIEYLQLRISRDETTAVEDTL